MIVGDSSENTANRRKNFHLSSFFLLLYHTQTYKKRVRKKTRNKKEEPRWFPSLPSTSLTARHGVAAPEMKKGGRDCEKMDGHES